MTEKTHGALAIFVRSPQASQTHHRLSKTLGKIAAETFHHLSAQAMESVALDNRILSGKISLSFHKAKALSVSVIAAFTTSYSGCTNTF